MQVVGIRAAHGTVSEFLECTIAAHFMANRIVAPVVDLPADADCRQDVHEALGVTHTPLFEIPTHRVHTSILCKFVPCMATFFEPGN